MECAKARQELGKMLLLQMHGPLDQFPEQFLIKEIRQQICIHFVIIFCFLFQRHYHKALCLLLSQNVYSFNGILRFLEKKKKKKKGTFLK